MTKNKKINIFNLGAILTVCLLVSSFFLPVAKAAFNQHKVQTVKQAKSMKDDAWVVLKGRIVAKVGKDKYTFTDGTASILVDIDNDIKFPELTAKDVITLEGEIDKDFLKSPKLDVSRIVFKGKGYVKVKGRKYYRY